MSAIVIETSARAEPEVVLAAPQPEQAISESARAAAVLTDPGAAPERRHAAAELLLDQSPDDLADLIAALASPGVAAIVVEAASDNPDRARSLLDHATADQIEPADRIRLIETIAQTRSPETARTLIGELDAEPTRTAAADALMAMTGRSDLGTDPAAWRAWDQALAELSGEQWIDALVSDLATRVTHADERAARAERRLADAFRRLYLVTDAAGRPAILAELLGLEQAPVLQALGFELSERELAANVGLDGTVADAAIGLLEHRDPQVRARAARLVSRLAPPGAAEVVARVLAAETSPVAAEPLLQASTRWPSPQLVGPVLRWLADDRTREAACQAGVALFDAGLLVGAEARERVRSLLMPLPASPSSARLILLGQAGNESDRESIAALLHAGDAAVRSSASDALARSDAGAATLVEAAVAEPTIAPDVLAALARHNRLDAAADQFDSVPIWEAAFELAPPNGGRASIASHILTRFGATLTPEQKTIYEAASDPAG